MKDMTPIERLRHSCAHVLAAAVLRRFPTAKLDIGPPTSTGFYYDFELEAPLSTEDLKVLEEEMGAIVRERQKFVCREVTRPEAAAFFKERNQGYKLERLADIPEGETITFFQNGEFTDLCAGAHVEHTGEIKAFKLMAVSGVYYRGDETKAQLQRITGTAFASKDELKKYLEQLEEAKKRDHRKIGREQDLFLVDEKVGQGLILWQPNGAIIRQALQTFIQEALDRQGYQQVFTPHIGKLDLYRTSGHFPYYADSQFPPLLSRELLSRKAQEGCSCADLVQELESGELDGYLLKPMNCPMHIRIYSARPRSYKDLPLRLAEFGTVYRWEQSGELNGMTRVRGFTQDDAHLFCTPDQIGQELLGCLELVKTVFGTLGMQDYRVRIGKRDPESSKYAGDPASWEAAEAALKAAVATLAVNYSEEPGEGAFYGPKIDFIVRDAIGREWQLGTVQLDYVLPERFDLSYIGADNTLHRPVMIHRAPFGSMERFVGLLIEHFAGNFPTWLAPEQVRILPIKDSLIPYGQKVYELLKSHGLRVHLDSHQDTLGAKIRKAETQKVPYMFVVGDKEADSNSVAVRSRLNPQAEGTLSLEAAVAHLVNEVKDRTLITRK